MFRKEAGCPAPPCSRTVANLFFRKSPSVDGKIEFTAQKNVPHIEFSRSQDLDEWEIVVQAYLEHHVHLLIKKIIFFAER